MKKQALNETRVQSGEMVPIGECVKAAFGKLKIKSETESKTSWPSLRPLPALLPSAPALPVEMVPEPIRQWVADAAERMQVALEMITAPAIVAAGSVIGRKLAIAPKRHDDWTVIPNLWGAVVCRPGQLKTASSEEALRPLHGLETRARNDYEQASAVRQASLEIHRARIDAVRDGIRQAAKKKDEVKLAELQAELLQLESKGQNLEDSQRRYIVSVPTVEKLAELLRANPNGILLYRDELSGWLRSLEKSGREGDREFYLEGWNGSGKYTVDRIGRGTIHVPALCLSIFGGLQPAKLSSYVADAVRGGAGDDGLIQRFQLLVYPDSPSDWRNVDRTPDIQARDRAYQIYQQLDTMQPQCSESRNGVPILRLSEKAQNLFDHWRVALEKRLLSDEIGGPALESHMAKYRSLIPSLALIFHLIEWADSGGQLQPVSVDAMRLAAAWGDFLEAHARKVYAPIAHPELLAAYALAAKIRAGKIKDRDAVRSVYRACWSALGSRQAVSDALAMLSNLGWLRTTRITTDGRPTDIIRLHPDLRKEE